MSEIELFSAAVEVVADFDQWYARYPKHQGKAKARGYWAKMSSADRADAWAALDGWERYAAVKGNKYVPMASTWLYQRRWEDDAPEHGQVEIAERKPAPGMGALRARAARINQ